MSTSTLITHIANKIRDKRNSIFKEKKMSGGCQNVAMQLLKCFGWFYHVAMWILGSSRCFSLVQDPKSKEANPQFYMTSHDKSMRFYGIMGFAHPPSEKLNRYIHKNILKSSIRLFSLCILFSTNLNSTIIK